MRLSWLLLVVPLLAAAVEGQAPAAPTLTLMVMDVPAGPATMRPGAEHAIPFTVHVLASNFACAAEATLPIEISDASTGRPAFLRAHGMPPTVNATIPAGAYAGDTRGFAATLDAQFMIMVGDDATAHQHTVKVRAASPGGLPAGCHAAGAFPAAESLAEHTVRIEADAAAPADGPRDGAAANGTGGLPAGAAPPATNNAPAAGVVAGAAAVAAAGFALGRR